jgi:8-amino-7-oxononanoate synthase
MLDFTSALYLGMRHPSRALRPWAQLTAGRPAALCERSEQTAAAAALASLVGCEAAQMGASTLHLFWDLGGMLSRDSVIYLDAGTYAVGRWGAQRAAARGISVKLFPHYDPAALERMMAGAPARRRRAARPVVVADGFCPGCGVPAPVAAYARLVGQRGGLLVLDDTQALGVLGHGPCNQAPLGRGGGGSLRYHGLADPHVVLISSLAKAFGAPLAVLAGSTAMVRGFAARSETRLHASPPSVAALHAAQHALAVNRAQGDRLRQHLAQLTRALRSRLAASGHRCSGGAFPVQTLKHIGGTDAESIYRALLAQGVRTVLHRARAGAEARISFLLTARHAMDDIERAARAVEHVSGMHHGGYLRQEVNHERPIPLRG